MSGDNPLIDMSGDNPLINSTDLWNDVIYSDVETQLVAQGYEVDTIQALFSDTGASMGDYQAQINQIVDDGLKNVESKRQSFWSESVAVGDECFIQSIQQELSGRVPGRSIVSENGTSSLQEPQSLTALFLRGKRGF